MPQKEVGEDLTNQQKGELLHEAGTTGRWFAKAGEEGL